LLPALFLLSVLPPGTAAQAVPLPTFIPRTIETNAALWWARAYGDVNRNGLTDILLQDNNGHGGVLRWYETRNQGTAWTMHVIAEKAPNGSPFAAGDLAAADINNDGALDVLGLAHPGEWKQGGAPTEIYWYQNPSPEGDPARDAWTAHHVGRAPAFVKDLRLADFNSDGRLDLVTISFEGNRFLVFRQNSPTQWTKVQDFALPNLHEGLDVGDITGNGRPDVAANGYWIENPGGDLTGEWIVRSIDEKWHNQTGDWSRNATKVFCRDITGDGRAEVFLSHSERAGYPASWYRADDPRTGPWVEHVLTDKLLAVHTLQVWDFNGDGHYDVLAGVNAGRARALGAREFPVVLFLNSGDNRRWQEHVLSTEGIYNGQVADLAGNGAPDIFRMASHDANRFEVLVNQSASAKRRSHGPLPGDVFREYLWTHTAGDAGGSLRVGGRLDYGGGPITLPHDLDLNHASRAEVFVEKLLCHDGTRGLSLSVNSNAWLTLPEAPGIPEPQWDYLHLTYPLVAVPLSQLRPGVGNQVRLRVSDEHPWKWPQNLIYGVHIRVYYDPAKKPHPTGRLTSPKPGATLGTRVALEAEASCPNGRIRQVDFIGHYEDVNFQGDGEYTNWQYHFHRAVLTNHIGSVASARWRMTWDTSWVPDQREPFHLAARVTDETGLTYFTEAVGGLTFQRGGLSVELCKPYDVPKRWLTRTGEHQEKFRVTGDLSRAVAARLVWVSWSPGYMEGLYLNDHKVLDREGPRYACYIHRVPVLDLTLLKPGENVLRTGKTPLYDGKMVHGMELNWPGIMVLIQYRQPAPGP
jgi:hypothetical protein